MKHNVNKIVAVHLLNDYSGSPLVFAQALETLSQAGASVDLYTNNGEGFLSKLDYINKNIIPYQWKKNKLFTLMYYFYAQLWLFFTLLVKYRREHVIIYINTVLPFGAALAGLYLNQKVVYHLHESSVKPKLLKRFLFGIANMIATEAIYVSDFLRKTEPLSVAINHLVYNALPTGFKQQAQAFQEKAEQHQGFRVLMLCSLKEYKGVRNFVALAKALPMYQFTLVLNATWLDIRTFFPESEGFPANLMVYPKQNNVHPFYQKADLVVNLSKPEQWLETFGMTILEGMAYGLPAIVPPAGGVVELIDDGINGYHVHPDDAELFKTAN